MSVLDAFPRRPLKIRPVRHWLLSLCLLALGIGVGAHVLTNTFPAILDDLRLQDSTNQAASVQIGYSRCTVTGGFLDYECKFDVIYSTSTGEQFTTRVDIETLFERIPAKEMPLVVRYDPQRPGHISTSWGVARLTNRILTLMFFIVPVGIGLSSMAFFVAYQQVKSARAASSIGANPMPVAATITGYRSASRYKFNFVDPMGRTFSSETELKKKMQPFWMDLRKTQALALANDRGQAVLLDANLKMVNLTDPERAVILAARDAAMNAPVKGSDLQLQIPLTAQEAMQGKTIAIAVPALGGEKQMTVQVPAGVAHGARLRLPGVGRLGANGGAQGDVYLNIEIRG